MDLGYAGKTVVITGASRGLGRACAEGFARENANLHLVARSRQLLEEAKGQLTTAYGVKISIQVEDIASSDSASRIHAACPDADVLVNNAGGIKRGELLELDEPAWRQAWELKVFGYVNLTREYYRVMTARKSGVILNVVGLAGVKHQYDYAAGSMGNAALGAFTRTIGSESPKFGVRVLGVNPGWVDTARGIPLMEKYAQKIYSDPTRWRDVIGTWGLARFIEPAELADTVVYLASSRASAISGEVVNVDLGFNANNYHMSPVKD